MSFQDCSKDVDFSNRRLPAAEQRRRRAITSVRCFLRVIINDVYVARTRKCFVDWPSFEVNFMEKLQIYLFSKPSSMKLEVVMGNFFLSRVVDTINIEIPGELANTITSSGTIFRESQFSKDISKIHRREEKKLNKLVKQKRDAFEAQKVREAAARKKEEQVKAKINAATNSGQTKPDTQEEFERKKRQDEEINENLKKRQEELDKEIEKLTSEFKQRMAKESPVQGMLYYKSEWSGFGPKLPPPSLDKFEEKKKSRFESNRIEITDLNQMYDLNDPRNEYVIQKLRELKNHQINRILERDAQMPYNDVLSLRQRLYELRKVESELCETPIPLLQEEIEMNRRLIHFIEVFLLVLSSADQIYRTMRSST